MNPRNCPFCPSCGAVYDEGATVIACTRPGCGWESEAGLPTAAELTAYRASRPGCNGVDLAVVARMACSYPPRRLDPLRGGS